MLEMYVGRGCRKMKFIYNNVNICRFPAASAKSYSFIYL